MKKPIGKEKIGNELKIYIGPKIITIVLTFIAIMYLISKLSL